MTTRRQAVRVVLFERAQLRGFGGGVRCAIIDLSAVGARLALTGRVPEPPLWLEFQLDDQALKVKVEIKRAAPGEHVAVAFVDPPIDRLHRLIATEQRKALAAGRRNVRDRRAPPPGSTRRGEVLP